jgi:hypothetical protein
MYDVRFLCSVTKLGNLGLKTRPKHLLVALPLGIELLDPGERTQLEQIPIVECGAKANVANLAAACIYPFASVNTPLRVINTY